MICRKFLMVLVLTGMTPLLAHAGSIVDKILPQLESQGFDRVEISKTWLGRTRIIATAPGSRREIILNPRTGEILRDLWSLEDDSSVDAALLNLFVREDDNEAGGADGQDDSGHDDDDDGDDNSSDDGSGDDDDDNDDGSDDDDDDDDSSSSDDSDGGDDSDDGDDGDDGDDSGDGDDDE